MSLPVPVSITLVFQDPSGSPLASGKVRIKLSTDGSLGATGGSSVAGGRTTLVTLDSSGSATFNIWPTTALLPPGAVYFVIAYSATGHPVWQGQMTVDGSGNITWILK